MQGFERQIAVVNSRQEFHKRIDALPEDAEILMISSVRVTDGDGRVQDLASIDAVGMTVQYRNERVAWMLHTALTFLTSGLFSRG